ncbi:hypothetical protein R3P38DRAFT_2779770 [Favolaschia claudopus]|uniref:Uncharacterized protein n=1 Tax=Favolaschia claudopus TaxID=2862362 RepID=A0AAW0B9P6_9AGAR
MLELLRCARTISKLDLLDDEDSGFLNHAKATVDRRFNKIATPTHWLALFLHPLCRKLALPGDARTDMWKWERSKATKMVADLKAYSQCKAPFTGTFKHSHFTRLLLRLSVCSLNSGEV